MEPTKSQRKAAEVTAELRSRNPLLWVKTSEEARIKPFLFEAAATAKYQTHVWNCAAGVTSIDGKPERARSDYDPPEDADTVLEEIRKRSTQDIGGWSMDRSDRGVWILCDLPPWLQGLGGAVTLRRLRNLAQSLPGTPRKVAQAIVVLSPSGEVPPELAGHATVIEWPLPDRDEIAALLDAAVITLPAELKGRAVNGNRDAAIDAAVGLSGEEAQACFARSIIQLRRIDPAMIAAQKKRAIAASGVLEWVDPPAGGRSIVGGLDEYLGWLVSRALAFSPEARAYGLPAPKGTMVIGISGCGKSLSAKAIAAEWGVPLIRLDLGALKSKFVGESETNLRKALDVIEAIGRCVVWLDEIEKALAGASGEAGDGGVSADALGAILTWMQDRQGEAFVIATANDAEKLPPEFLRKGRFDEVWWVDLPNRSERAEVLAAAVRANGRDAAAIGIDLIAVADVTDQFTGAEIAALVPDALFTAFAEDAREISTDDLIEAAGRVKPLARLAEEKIQRLREKWTGRARPATSQTAAPVAATSAGRALDL